MGKKFVLFVQVPGHAYLLLLMKKYGARAMSVQGCIEAHAVWKAS